MPCAIRGCVHYYKGIYDILINKNLSYYKKKKTLLHELAHIELNQLCQSNKDLFAFFIDSYEDEADKYIKKIMKEVRAYENHFFASMQKENFKNSNIFFFKFNSVVLKYLSNQFTSFKSGSHHTKASGIYYYAAEFWHC